MILSFSFQLKTFILSILIGFAMGFFYDWIRIFRRVLFHKNILIQIEDIIYWNFMAGVIFLICLYQNNGEIRAFFIIGIVLGMCTYFFTISKIFISVSTKIINLIKIIIKFIFECILMPFKIVLKVILSILSPITKLFKKYFIKIFKNIRKVLQNNKKCVKIYNKLNYINNKILNISKYKNKKFLGDKDAKEK